MRDNLTQEVLKQHVSYDELTGVFTRLVGKGKGKQAGSINKHRHYVYIRVGGYRYMAHRLAWLYHYGEFPTGEIDHINQIKQDNRIVNLRDVTKTENQKNRSVNKNSVSGITGVYFSNSRWYAQITINGKVTPLGSFKTKHEAVNIRAAANIVHNFHENHGQQKENIHELQT